MKGFTLLEVMIATAIASVISVVLFVALRQTMGYQQRVDTLVETYTRAALIQNQLERDFMGFFVPNEAYELVSTKTGEKTSGREKAEQIDKIFYATKNKEQFGMLSFITTNAMQVYWGKTMGMPKPLVARVVYRLVKSTSRTGHPERVEGRRAGNEPETDSYVLTRQESRRLDFAPFEGAPEKQKIRAYEIVGDVKSMKVVYGARVYPSASSGQVNDGKEASKDSKKKENPTWSYREFTEWDWSPKNAKSKDAKSDKSSSAKASKDASKDAKETVSRVPMYIKVNLELWNPEHTVSTPFEFVFMRKPFEMQELEKDEADKPAPKMPDLKPMLDMFRVPMGTPATPPQQQVQVVPNQNSMMQNVQQRGPGIRNPHMPNMMPGMRMPVINMPNHAVAQAHSAGSGQANQGVR